MSSSSTTAPRALTTRTGAWLSAAVLALGLGACSDGDESGPEETRGADSRTCRLVAVTDASLEGTRDALARGLFEDHALAAYETAVDTLTGSVAGEGEIDPAITAGVVGLVAAISSTLAIGTEYAAADSYQPERVTDAIAEEQAAYDAFVAACPPVLGAE
jgi:hypothetical protein